MPYTRVVSRFKSHCAVLVAAALSMAAAPLQAIEFDGGASVWSVTRIDNAPLFMPSNFLPSFAASFDPPAKHRSTPFSDATPSQRGPHAALDPILEALRAARQLAARATWNISQRAGSDGVQAGIPVGQATRVSVDLSRQRPNVQPQRADSLPVFAKPVEPPSTVVSLQVDWQF